MTVLTPTQLKTLNLILAEHKQWSQEIPLLNKQISDLELLNQTCEEKDSLRLSEIDLYATQHEQDRKKLDKLTKSIKKWKIGTYSSLGAVAALLISLLIVK